MKFAMKTKNYYLNIEKISTKMIFISTKIIF